MVAVGLFSEPQQAGHSDASPAQHRRREVHRLAVLDEPVGSRHSGCRLTPVNRGQRAVAVEVKQEAAPADPGAFGFEQGQRDGGGDGGIDRAPAAAKHAGANLGSQAAGRANHPG